MHQEKRKEWVTLHEVGLALENYGDVDFQDRATAGGAPWSRYSGLATLFAAAHTELRNQPGVCRGQRPGWQATNPAQPIASARDSRRSRVRNKISSTTPKGTNTPHSGAGP